MEKIFKYTGISDKEIGQLFIRNKLDHDEHKIDNIKYIFDKINYIDIDKNRDININESLI